MLWRAAASGHIELHGALAQLGRHLAEVGDGRVDLSAGLFESLPAVLHAAGMLGLEETLEVLARRVAPDTGHVPTGKDDDEDRGCRQISRSRSPKPRSSNSRMRSYGPR
jgi:hypothetical protein